MAPAFSPWALLIRSLRRSVPGAFAGHGYKAPVIEISCPAASRDGDCGTHKRTGGDTGSAELVTGGILHHLCKRIISVLFGIEGGIGLRTAVRDKLTNCAAVFCKALLCAKIKTH